MAPWSPTPRSPEEPVVVAPCARRASTPTTHHRHWVEVLAAVVVALAATGCTLERHDAAGPTDDNDCYHCHRSTYELATMPPHVGEMPTTCRDCHSTTAWRPAGRHPDDRFPIRSGPHGSADCAACHDPALGSSVAGANTNCLTCHPSGTTAPPHQGVPGYTWDPGMPHGCLTCHPRGLAANHPEDRFPITTGPHQMACADCHDRSRGPDTGGANTSCTGCHTGEHDRPIVDAHHREVSGYAWSDSDPHFCLTCHPRGRN